MSVVRYPPAAVRAAGWYMFLLGILMSVAMFFGAILGALEGPEGLVGELSTRGLVLTAVVTAPAVAAAMGLRIAYPVALAAAGYGLVSGLLAWGENPNTLGFVATIPPFGLLLMPSSWRWALGLDRKRTPAGLDEVAFRLPARGEDELRQP